MASTIDYSIKDIEKIVQFDGQVKNVEVARLTAPGENYLSLVLRIDFEVEKNGHTKTISTVAKRLPLSVQKAGFDFHAFAMRNEIQWYSEIVPILKDFAKESGLEIDFFPEYYGSRYSLEDSSKKKADSDSVLLLENLIPQGYHNDDRHIGCDLSTSKAILQNLAQFHALVIAIKVIKPETFNILKDYFEQAHPKLPDKNDPADPDDIMKQFGPPPGAPKPEEILIEQMAKIPDFAPYLDKIKILLEKQPPMRPDTFNIKTQEPWNTVNHNDFWVNNIMVNKEVEKEPLVKIVDFQMCTYGSYAKDLVFFLLSSVRNDVTKESLDDLLKTYYEEFISVLRKANSNLELHYEDYLEEVRNTAAELEVTHAINFSTIIFGQKGGIGVDIAVEEFKPYEHMTTMLKNMSQNHKDKLVIIASEADKRNWIKLF